MEEKKDVQNEQLKESMYLKSGYQEEPCSLQYYFDQMAMCLTVTSQIRHYYRYGDYNKCKGAFTDFKWCLSTKSKSPEEQQKMLQQRRLDQWVELREGPNSEDIWNVRTQPKD
ncbi:DUF3128 family, c22orf39-like protein [Schizosaccharomyces osmophilus]|uniref:DUF3128 family, c22orf39-like protein n=1 Tax=Schizosaccharomyces osmophilus TaxID=2545709 RepID=A0AAE9W7T4_9SCHI|nr:DUF3128 family, c22orf39-like protein [Schizosaccharomyces osmophilus]WBW71411.1 DUF3128 family, c22orf39-like protein [Schizosaccharomyces osmophilus]